MAVEWLLNAVQQGTEALAETLLEVSIDAYSGITGDIWRKMSFSLLPSYSVRYKRRNI